MDLIHQALRINPNFPEACYNLGVVLERQGQLDQAITAFQQAITLKPDYAQAHNNLGNALCSQGRLDEAIAACRQATILQPNFAEAHCDLGSALHEKGDRAAAIAAYRRALACNANLPEAHYNLAQLLLLQGDFAPGWTEQEWRGLSKNFPSRRQNFPQPQWDGSALAGRTILLHLEQGYGDVLQFVRYVPMVAARGGTVILACVPELRRLLKDTPGVMRWLMDGEPLPTFDVHCPLLSLPLAFGTSLQNIPQTVPYLHADAQDTARWREVLAADTQAFKVGLVWAGRPTHINDRNRSLSLNALAPLAQVPGVSFYSLQKGPASQQALTPPPGLSLIDHTAELKDFADTASLIANLDLVISVDTAVVHLAGAMAKPVWTLLPSMPDWRWLLDRDDSPWYPTMRLFRQSSRGDWAGVITQVTQALAALVHRS